MKTPVELGIRPELVARVSNALHDDLSVDELNQDILAVELRNGFLIDVGWFPENDPSGHFWIRVFGHDWSNQVTPSMKLREVQDVVERVRMLAERYGRPGVVSVPDSTDTPGTSVTI